MSVYQEDNEGRCAFVVFMDGQQPAHRRCVLDLGHVGAGQYHQVEDARGRQLALTALPMPATE